MSPENKTRRKPVIKGRPDYYLTPTRDFKQYTKDAEEKYWSKDTKFDWSQDVRANLRENLEGLDADKFKLILFMVLPMVEDSIETKITLLQRDGLPLDEDALKDIAECIPDDRSHIHKAIDLLSPLKTEALSLSGLKDRLEITESEHRDLKEQQRLGFYKKGLMVKRIETEVEKQDQSDELARLQDLKKQLEEEIKQVSARNIADAGELKRKLGTEINAIGVTVLTDLKATLEMIRGVRQTNKVPEDQELLLRLKDLILKRQLRALKDIANHALVVEQSAIAPLTMGIIHYKRYREIQEAMTTFIRDEAKHSATFRRYLVEKLEAKEFISDILIKGASRYMWLARFMPGAGLFLAVMVEAIGAAYLEFFADERYMPEKLFCSICKTISIQDETRHMDLCAEMYNELFRTGQKWEKMRNHAAMKVLLKSVYGDKDDDHHLIQAFRAFGVESEVLYRYITGKLSVQLARVSVYAEPDKLLEFIGIAKK